jgi:hypothetical protein
MPAPTPRIAHRNAPAYGDHLIVRESTIGLKAAAKQPAVAGQPSPREPQARRRLSRR